MDKQSCCCTSHANDMTDVKIISIETDVDSLKKSLFNYLKCFNSDQITYIIDCLFKYSYWNANQSNCEYKFGRWLKLQIVNTHYSKPWNPDSDGKKVDMQIFKPYNECDIDIKTCVLNYESPMNHEPVDDSRTHDNSESRCSNND